MSPVTYVGLKWIASGFGVDPVQPFAVESAIGATRKTVVLEGMRHETYPHAFMPGESVAEHLKFSD